MNKRKEFILNYAERFMPSVQILLIGIVRKETKCILVKCKIIIISRYQQNSPIILNTIVPINSNPIHFVSFTIKLRCMQNVWTKIDQLLYLLR